MGENGPLNCRPKWLSNSNGLHDWLLFFFSFDILLWKYFSLPQIWIFFFHLNYLFTFAHALQYIYLFSMKLLLYTIYIIFFFFSMDLMLYVFWSSFSSILYFCLLCNNSWTDTNLMRIFFLFAWFSNYLPHFSLGVCKSTKTVPIIVS